ncbi:MAG: hypothetical protein K9L88_13170 [Chromatiaceae bacterium]|nr:hypothetical protein [Chromatiaceae bacterium]
MLVNVPTGYNTLARNVILNHPNTYNCEVYRRSYLRPGDALVGGMMTLSSEDESEIEWELVGMGFALPAEQFAPSPMMDRGDAHNAMGDEFRYLLEPEVPIGEPGGFEIKKADVIYVRLGTGEAPPKVAFEIIAVETVINSPPFVPRYILVRRNDLDLLDAGAGD